MDSARAGSRVRNAFSRTLSALGRRDQPQRDAPAGRQPPPRSALTGTPAADLVGPDPSGAPAELRWAGADRTLVAFLTGGCRTCQAFWTAVSDEETVVSAGLSVVVVTPDPGLESRRGVTARAGDGLTVIMSTDAWMAYGVTGAPWFAVVADGAIEWEGHARTWPDLLTMIGR